MGYETCLLFIDERKYTKDKGYARIEATLEMGCICNDMVGKLIEKSVPKKTTKEKLRKQIKAWEKQRAKCYTSDGEYTEEMNDLSEKEREIECDKSYKMSRELDKKLYHVCYSDKNTQQYTDCYGDVLIVVSLADLKEAITLDQAKMIHTKEYDIHGYRRFAMALAVIEQFENKEHWDENIKVIMWGH